MNCICCLADPCKHVRKAKEHMSAIPFGGRWPEVPVVPVEPGLKAFDARYTVTIEATDEKAATKLANAIAEFMMDAASAHDDQGVAAVQTCGHSVAPQPFTYSSPAPSPKPEPTVGWDANGSPTCEEPWSL